MFISNSDGDVTPRYRPIEQLLTTLGAYIFGIVDLSDAEMLELKSELVEFAESCQPGQIICLEGADVPTFITAPNNVWALVGKLLNGQIIVWHQPLPWPFEQEKRDAA